MLRYHGVRNGEWYEQFIPHRKCTAEDWARFDPIIEENRGMYEKYKNDPSYYLNCIDWDNIPDQDDIWGSNPDQNKHQWIEFVLVPCNYVHAEYGDVGDTIHEDCIADR